jgi:probable F420-dependent oxidoreductase
MAPANRARSRTAPKPAWEPVQMMLDATVTNDLAGQAAQAKALAGEGYDGLWVGESRHDPFLRTLVVAGAAPEVQVGTSIAIAFARTPMTVANSAYDLAHYTGGRFVLGLGSQIRPHVEHRYSMPWSAPARRMREFVLALRAIWACWHDGEPLEFRGEFYTHTLMTPNFTPTRIGVDPPPIFVAAVGPRMVEVTGEVADGLLVHPFHTVEYLRQVTLPALRAGHDRSGRAGSARPVLAGPAFVATGRDEQEIAAAVEGVRARLAFYGSTPAYRAVLDLHGWGDLQPRLNALSKQGRWDEMNSLVPDEWVHTFAAVGSPQEVARTLSDRYAGLLDRLTVHMPYPHHPASTAAVAVELRAVSV